jgi:hypothetical protein
MKILSVVLLLFAGNVIFPSLLRSEEIADKKDVSTLMSEVWCDKLMECDKESGMDLKECRKVLKKSFLSGFDNVAGVEKLEVGKSQLEECSGSIKKNSCEALKSAQTLPGCGFITYLNRY